MYNHKVLLENDASIKRDNREKIITKKVKDFYEKIQFPGRRPMEQDSLIFYRKFSKLIDSEASKDNPIKVLDAGCGTGNTSIALSMEFEKVYFTGIDISAASILRAQQAAEERNLNNVQFYEWDLLDSLDHEEKYNIILCFGVLHHTAHMQKVLKNLHASLKRDGIIFLWVYGEYGRYRHSLNLQLLSMLLNSPPKHDNPIDLARKFILNTGNSMVINDLLGVRKDDLMLRDFYTDSTWIADQFLNPNELTLNLKQLLLLTNNADLRITEWIGVKKDASNWFSSPELKERFNNLSEEEQMLALDLLLKPDRYFLTLKNNNG